MVEMGQPANFRVRRMRGFRNIGARKFVGFPCLFVLALTLCAKTKRGHKLAPYSPTPATIVDKMLELGGLKPGEKMYDLGSGDGRIVIMAARKYKADATGGALEESVYKQS